MQEVFDFPITPKYSFDNFVVCSGNRAAYHFARQLAEEDGENLLYIYGPPGSGKTHLLLALGTMLGSKEGATTPAPSISFKEIDDIYHGIYPAEDVSKLAERFRGSALLLIDDLHLIPDNANVKVELWQLFNDFYTAGKKIVVTGLYPPKELPHLDGHLVSRLLWGLVAKMDTSDDDSRRMIMQKLAADRQIRIPDDVIDYLLVHARRDIPSLTEALEWIRRLSFATQKKVTVRLAREALG
ncbi:MAG TPA: DnaA/Hda family protein [Geobacteraceae bacterium]